MVDFSMQQIHGFVKDYKSRKHNNNIKSCQGRFFILLFSGTVKIAIFKMEKIK